MTLNRYIEIMKVQMEPKLNLSALYTKQSVDDSFVDFIDNLGRSWFWFLGEIGGFTSRYRGWPGVLLNS